MSIITHLRADNDLDGNPQRLYALHVGGEIMAVWDERHEGHHAVPHLWRKQAYESEAMPKRISVKTYNDLKERCESPAWAELVSGYDRLKEFL
jgi:hypothetical protein